METGEIRKEIDRAIAGGDAAQAAKMLTALWAKEPGAALAGFVASRFDRVARAWRYRRTGGRFCAPSRSSRSSRF